MLRVVGLVSLGIACVDDIECAKRKGADSKCVLMKTAPTCGKNRRCSDPNKKKAYQSCECNHLNNGTCMDIDYTVHFNEDYYDDHDYWLESNGWLEEDCDGIVEVDDVCPEHPVYDQWKCCINYRDFWA